MTDYVPPSTQRISDLLTGLLDDGYDQAVSPVVRAIASDLTDSQLTKALDALDKEAARLEALGEKMQPDNPVFRMVMSDLRDTLQTEAAVINGVSADVVGTGIDAAGQTVRQLAVGGLSDAQLRGVGIAWNTPDPEAVRALVDYTRTGAWRDMFAAYPDDLADTIGAIAIRGIVNGDGPRAIARELRQHIDTLLPYQADSLMRTLQLTSYRDAAVAHRLSNADILSYQVRIAALDARTCIACLALHGKKYPIDERIDDHPNGRCDSITVVKGFEDERNIETGQQWFDALSPDRQREMMGNAAYEAYKAGEVRLDDFVGKRTDDVFGSQVYEQSLRGVLGDGAQRYYKDAA
jgi:SPP1 gp7 family putative phage head morphogenesis protein